MNQFLVLVVGHMTTPLRSIDPVQQDLLIRGTCVNKHFLVVSSEQVSPHMFQMHRYVEVLQVGASDTNVLQLGKELAIEVR